MESDSSNHHHQSDCTNDDMSKDFIKTYKHTQVFQTLTGGYHIGNDREVVTWWQWKSQIVRRKESMLHEIHGPPKSVLSGLIGKGSDKATVIDFLGLWLMLWKSHIYLSQIPRFPVENDICTNWLFTPAVWNSSRRFGTSLQIVRTAPW